MSATAILTGVDLLLQFIDRTTAAAAIIKQARAEGRAPSVEELSSLRGALDSHLSALDAAIAQAESEGR